MKLKELRAKYNISQTELAKQLDISQKSISNYESGISEPTESNLIKMAKLFNLTIDELVGHEVPYLIDKSLLSEKQLNLINLIQKLNDYQCDKVEAFIMGISLAEIERQQTIEKFKNRGK